MLLGDVGPQYAHTLCLHPRGCTLSYRLRFWSEAVSSHDHQSCRAGGSCKVDIARQTLLLYFAYYSVSGHGCEVKCYSTSVLQSTSFTVMVLNISTVHTVVHLYFSKAEVLTVATYCVHAYCLYESS